MKLVASFACGVIFALGLGSDDPVTRFLSADGSRTRIIARPAGGRLFIEAEPNDTPEQAQPLALKKAAEDYSLRVVGGSDDIEYYDNSRVGGSGDDV